MRSWLTGRAAAVVSPIVGVAAVVGVWWLAVIAFHIQAIFLPEPPQLIDAFVQQGRPEYLARRSLETLAEVAVGFTIAMLSGVLTAIVLAAFGPVRRALMPVLVGLNAIPKVALIPLLVVWLGFGIQPKIVMTVIICFFPIVVATMSGLASTPADLGELTRALCASKLQTYLKVRLPWALPQIFVGFKVAVPLAVIGAVVAENNNPNRGLGSVIVVSMQSLDTPLAFACLLLLAVMSVGLYYLIEGVERVVLPWSRAISAELR